MKRHLEELANHQHSDLDVFSNLTATTVTEKPATTTTVKPVYTAVKPTTTTVKPVTTTFVKPAGTTYTKPTSFRPTALNTVSRPRPLPIYNAPILPVLMDSGIANPNLPSASTTPAATSGGGGGGAGGGGMEEKSVDAATTADAGAGVAVATILGFEKTAFLTGVGLGVVGAIAGFFTAKHYKKSVILGAVIGAAAGTGGFALYKMLTAPKAQTGTN